MYTVHSHSLLLNHLLTHSTLINLFIKFGLNIILLLPPLISIGFVPSTLRAYVWQILASTRKAYIFAW